jgi:hypothetical protein
MVKWSRKEIFIEGIVHSKSTLLNFAGYAFFEVDISK